MDNVFFVGDVDDSLERDIIMPLTNAVREQAKYKDGQIDLWINSFGGYVHLIDHIIELVEIAKRDGVIVRTIVPGVAFSAGSMLAVTGTPGHRFISNKGEHLIHYGQVASFETTPNQVERFSKWKDRNFKRNLEHYRKYCNIPNLEREMLDDGWFVTAKEAVRWGLADKYTTKLEL